MQNETLEEQVKKIHNEMMGLKGEDIIMYLCATVAELIERVDLLESIITDLKTVTGE